MYLLDGNPINIDAQFEKDGIQYPSGWLRAASEEDRAAIGVTEVPDPVRLDDRFYWVNDDGSATPKDMEMLRPQWVNEINNQCGTRLASSDWMVTRFVETGDKVPTDWEEFRLNTRSYSNKKTAEIEATTTVEELIAVIEGVPTPVPDEPGATRMEGGISWPLNPDEQAALDAANATNTGGTKN